MILPASFWSMQGMLQITADSPVWCLLVFFSPAILHASICSIELVCLFINSFSPDNFARL